MMNLLYVIQLVVVIILCAASIVTGSYMWLIIAWWGDVVVSTIIFWSARRTMLRARDLLTDLEKDTDIRMAASHPDIDRRRERARRGAYLRLVQADGTTVPSARTGFEDN